MNRDSSFKLKHHNLMNDLLHRLCRLMRKGYKRSLTSEDLFDLPSRDKTSKIYPIFEREWTKAQQRYLWHCQFLLDVISDGEVIVRHSI